MSGSFAAAAAWGLVVLAAFIGWGGELAARLFKTKEIDAGLRAAWGMALALLAGGVACLFHVATSLFVFAFVGIGAVLACLRWWRERKPFDSRALAALWQGRAGLLLAGICVALALVRYLISIAEINFNPNDDLLAYFPFARQILDTGTLFDPFSTRRVMSFGGQSLLHALVLAGVPQFRLHMLDGGICVLMAVLLVIGDRREGRPGWAGLVALLVFLTLPDVRVNTYPQTSGVVVFYALYRTLAWLEEREGIAPTAVIALVATAACTLRSNYIAVAIPMVAISYIRPVLRGRWREPLWCALFGLLFLAPWMILSWQSSGTPLFPVIRGHFNDAFPMLQDPKNVSQQIADLVATFRGNHVLPLFPLFVLAGFLLPESNPRKPLKSLLIASLLGWVLLISALASDVPSFLRYVYAFMVASTLAVLLAWPVRRVAQVIAAGAALVYVAQYGPEQALHYGYLFRALPQVAAAPIPRPETNPLWQRYRALQERVPPGETLLVMVDYPFLFDFARNQIYNVDTCAAVSPPPGFPYFQGPQRVADYLRGVNVRYVAFVTAGTARELYRRDHWQTLLKGEHFLWKAQAPVYLDIFDNFEAIARTHEIAYYDGSLVLVDLARTRAPSRPRG